MLWGEESQKRNQTTKRLKHTENTNIRLTDNTQEHRIQKQTEHETGVKNKKQEYTDQKQELPDTKDELAKIHRQMCGL